MKKYARIENNTVAEIIETDGDIATMFHPDMVWIECGDDVREGWGFSDGSFSAAPPASPPETMEEIVRMTTAALQGTLDELAASWGYDSAASAISYLGSTVPRLKAEAQAINSWRDAVWVWASAQQAGIEAGTITMPISLDAFMAGVPSAPSRPTLA